MPFNPRSMNNLVQNRAHGVGQRADKNRALPIVANSALPIEMIEIQQDASEILRNAAPDAALLLARLARGQIRAPVHLRMGAAVKVLEAAGLVGTQRPPPPGSFPSRAVIQQALALRAATAPSGTITDAVQVPAEGKASEVQCPT